MDFTQTSQPVRVRSEPKMDSVPVNIALRNYEYANPTAHPNSTRSWLALPEIPSSAEILNPEDAPDVDLPQNIVKGTWASKEDYVGAHYELLREDAVAPIRDAVATVRTHPTMNDNHNICIYENVHITGFTFNNAAPAVKVVFSSRRAQRNILWRQSKRLLPGTLVALTPAKDKFKTTCIVATVAARPMVGVLQNPPQVDLFFARPEDVQVDPMEPWLMVEARTGYFEAYKHSLVALQRLAHERFPLSDLLMRPAANCKAPQYVLDNPSRNLRRVFESVARPTPSEIPANEPANVPTGISPEVPATVPETISNAVPAVDPLVDVDILSTLPELPANVLDQTQISAFQSMLTKELAIVQGPPGTGKTHVSIMALKAILLNMKDNDPPVIVTSQTNHALDQMLHHISASESNFIRLGGRTKDHETIKPRTLREVRKNSACIKLDGDLRGRCYGRLRALTENMKMVLKSLQEKNPFRAELLRDLGVITLPQYESLIRGAEQWVQPGQDATANDGPVGMWLGSYDKELSLCEPDVIHSETEDENSVWETLGELEAEAPTDVADDEDADVLNGVFYGLKVYCHPHRRLKGGRIVYLDEPAKENALAQTDLYDIPEEDRGDVYRELWKRAAAILRGIFKEKMREYMAVAKDLKIGKWELDSELLRRAKIIGMTVTGLSKNRGLISSVKPRIIMLEEAAETLEGHVMSACVESLQHLILVGDHKQLRGHCSVQELEGDPFYLGVSMFERLVDNGFGFTTLRWQRRMIPEIRRLLTPIYGELQDHADVLSRPNVPGMGGRNTWFFDHLYPESSDSNTSRCNKAEADMIVGFFSYLVLNGVKSKDITVLTFYAGQKKTILKALRFHHNLQGETFKVVTVDSYQGEENKIVLLSLVRNNTRSQIGFLSVENRVCVALSRAQQGFYLFGNAKVVRTNTLWSRVLDIMAMKTLKISGKDENCLGVNLPITCSKHNKLTLVKDHTEWLMTYGGCDAACGEIMPCTHVCKIKCHPFRHNRVQCNEPCVRPLKCGHPCKEACKKECRCIYNCIELLGHQRKSSPDDWSAFARGGCAAEDARIARERREGNLRNVAQIEQKRDEWEIRQGLRPAPVAVGQVEANITSFIASSGAGSTSNTVYTTANEEDYMNFGVSAATNEAQNVEAGLLAMAIAAPIVNADASSVYGSGSAANSQSSETLGDLLDLGDNGRLTPISNSSTARSDSVLIEAPELISCGDSLTSGMVLDKYGFGSSLLD